MQRRFRPSSRRLLVWTLALAALPCLGPIEGRAALIRPDASQAFPDLSGDIVGTQNYVFDPVTGSGTFVVNNTPTLLAIGPNASSEYFILDSPDVVRVQSLSLKLDANGNLLDDPSNRFVIRGTVTIGDNTYTDVLLEGTPTRFGWADQNPATPTMSVFDVDMRLTGGNLKEAYGPDAYLRIITETNSTFDGTFTRNFSGAKALTNVRAYNAPTPNPIPEPSTFMILLACVAAGLLRGRAAFAGRAIRHPGA